MSHSGAKSRAHQFLARMYAGTMEEYLAVSFREAPTTHVFPGDLNEKVDWELVYLKRSPNLSSQVSIRLYYSRVQEAFSVLIESVSTQWQIYKSWESQEWIIRAGPLSLKWASVLLSSRCRQIIHVSVVQNQPLRQRLQNWWQWQKVYLGPNVFFVSQKVRSHSRWARSRSWTSLPWRWSSLCSCWVRLCNGGIHNSITRCVRVSFT